MTDFNSGGDPTNTDENNFHSGPANQHHDALGSGSPNDTNDADDNSVVLEYNGRGFTKADLVKKLSHGDHHIETLVNELKEQRGLLDDVGKTLKEQVDAREILEQMRNGEADRQEPRTQSQPKEDEPTPVSAEQIRKEVLESLKAEKDEVIQKGNWKSVTEQLTERFGDSVNQKVQEVADEFGMSIVEAADMAKKRPKAFLRLFPEAQGEKRPSIPERGRVNTQALKEPAARGSSGLFKAKSSKEQVSIYLQRLREAGV